MSKLLSNADEIGFCFSPDGKKVLYAAGQIDNTVFEVFALDISSSKVNKLTENLSYSRLPLWVEGHNIHA